MKAATALSFASAISASSVSRSFEDFKETCSKTYGTPGDELHAKECWKMNIDVIHRLNSASKYAQFAENCRADLCLADRSSGNRPVSPNADPDCDIMTDGDVSQYIDWDELGLVSRPVMNQGHCESCWSFSTTGAIESRLLQKGVNVSLSQMELISCSPHGGASCDEGGWPKRALDWVMNNNSGALAAEANYPYVMPVVACNTAELSDHAFSPLAVTSLTSYGATPLKLLFALQNDGPVGVDIWGSSDGLLNYGGGVLTASKCVDTGGKGYDHAVLLVGYGYDSELGLSYWKIKNSWGADWGEQGFVRVAYADGACGISSPEQPGGYGKCAYAPQLSGPTTLVTTTIPTTPAPPPPTTTAPHHDCEEVQPGCGQRMLWVPGCTGAGCLANGKDQDCAWCVYNLSKCEAHYGSACKDVQEAREQEGASCAPETVSV